MEWADVGRAVAKTAPVLGSVLGVKGRLPEKGTGRRT